MISRPSGFAIVAVVLAGLGLTGCADRSEATDVDALSACHEALSARDVTNPTPWPTTTRRLGNGWRVNVWTSGTAEGIPNYVCEVARVGNDRVKVTTIRP